MINFLQSSRLGFVIDCIYCGKKLILDIYKGYKIIPEQWAHYFRPLNISCRTDKEFWSKRHEYRINSKSSIA